MRVRILLDDDGGVSQQPLGDGEGTPLCRIFTVASLHQLAPVFPSVFGQQDAQHSGSISSAEQGEEQQRLAQPCCA